MSLLKFMHSSRFHFYLIVIIDGLRSSSIVAAPPFAYFSVFFYILCNV